MKLSTAALLLFLVVALFCILPTSSKGGRGGGGRSSGSRSSSSRGSSTSRSSSSTRNQGNANNNRQSSGSSTDRRNTDRDSSRDNSRRVQPSAPELPETKPIVPKSPPVQKQPAYNPHYADGDTSRTGNQPSLGDNRGNIRPDNSPSLGSSNANAPPASAVGINQHQGRPLNPPPNNAGPGQLGNPPPYGAGAGPQGNPPPYGAGAGPQGNPPPYGAGAGPQGNPPPYGAGAGPQGNPPPYGAGAGPQGNPPPYGVGPGPLGNPPPYSAGPGHLGNPPPYSAGPGYLGNPPPYSAGPGHLGNPPSYGAGPGNLGNPPAYGWAPGISNNPQTYGPSMPGSHPNYGVGHGNIGQPSPYGPGTGILGGQPSYGSHQPGYPNSFGGNQHGNRGQLGVGHGLLLGAAAMHGTSYIHRPSSIHSTSHSGYVSTDLNSPEKLKSYKRKGFLDSFLTMGHGSKDSKKTKMFSIAYPYDQYRRHEPRKYGVSPLYAILPMKILQKTPKPYKPSKYVKHWFLPIGSRHMGWRRRSFFDLDYDDDNNFAGRRCYKPFAPKNGELNCSRTTRGMHCNARCRESYAFPNNTLQMETECWHFSGYWKPTRYLPDCKPHCVNQCKNGGICIKPGECRCTAEYRGSECQYHFLQCDIRKLAGNNKIAWVCQHNIQRTLCSVSCKPPMEFDTPSPKSYYCHPNGTWTPDAMPNCVDVQRLDKTA